jgi:hypothetical protein
MKPRVGLRGDLWGLFDGAGRGAVFPDAADARGVDTATIISGADDFSHHREH